MKKLYKKAIAVKYLISLIVGLCILMFILWVIFGTQKENYNLLALIKDLF